MSTPASQPGRIVLALAGELISGKIRTALFCHLQDRWYLGELFCHATWVGALARVGVVVSVCTNRHYLELFQGHPAVVSRHAPEELTSDLVACHDLVVFTTTHPPSAYRPDVPLAIYAWNTGIAVARHGRVEWEQATVQTNLFAATCHQHGTTALPDGEYLTLHVLDHEREMAELALKRLLGGLDAPVTVVNPSASNALTRESDRPKAVGNVLDTIDYELLIRHLLREFPDRRVVIGAPIKPGDHANHTAIAALSGRFAGNERVVSLNGEVDPAEGLSLRAFAAVLSLEPVRLMVGNSTGSNTHLAAALDLPAVSIERGADDEVRANWRDRSRGQMGSFRWRNPHPCATAFRLSWQDRDDDAFRRVARLARWHGELREHGRRAPWLPADPSLAEIASRVLDAREGLLFWQSNVQLLAALLTAEQRAVWFDFRDEAEYLHITGSPRSAHLMDFLVRLGTASDPNVPVVDAELATPERDLVMSLLGSSNLAKLVAAVVTGPGSGSSSDVRGRA